MPRSNGTSRARTFLLRKIKAKNAAPIGYGRGDETLVVTIGNIDLPAFVSDGQLYLQAPLPHIFEAFAEDFSEFLGDMEIRVSTAGGATLSLDRNGRPILESAVAFEGMV